MGFFYKPYFEIAEHILEVISEKVASGELEDASTTISQMSSGSKERKPSKLRLADDGVQAKQKEGKSDGKAMPHPFRDVLVRGKVK